MALDPALRDRAREPLCSVIVVNFNGRDHLRRCLEAYGRQRHANVELLVVDNGSDDGSHRDLEGLPLAPRVLENPENGYAAALNLGLSEARGDYVVLSNNDVFVEPDWVSELVATLERDSRIGCAGGKLLFEDGRINSVGHRALPGYYWEDEGFGETDRGQYETEREVEGVCWAAVMFRRACIDEVSPLEEDYVLYYEDVDASLRCRQAGWKIVYVPRAVARHRFHGSSTGTFLAEYFCDRNRLIFLAKYHPEALAEAIRTSRFVERGDLDSLYRALLVALGKLGELHPAPKLESVLPEIRAAATAVLGSLATRHLFRRVEVIQRRRPMSIVFYDHALHLVGGGQRYGCEMAAFLQDRHEVTLLANRPIEREQLEGWYNLSLARCRVKTLPLPFFDDRGQHVDANLVGPTDENPFDALAPESAEADIFVNVNMLPLARPHAPFSIFICHFPDTLRRDRFAVDDYSCVLTNSNYTTEWAKKRWGIESHAVLYPPVAMQTSPQPKQNVILSVARFEAGGSKKQHVLIHAFEQLRRAHPGLALGWRLILVGGSITDNPYRDRIERLVRDSSAPIEMHVNVTAKELEGFYARAQVFWHACGLGEDDPHLIEHFGMTIVEAMQNGCVPIVFDGGGPREIVEHGRSGYRYASVPELLEHTARVMSGPNAMRVMSAAAVERAKSFSREVFTAWVDAFFSRLAREYRAVPRPDPRDVQRETLPPDLFYCKVARRAEELPPPPVTARRASLADVLKGAARAALRRSSAGR